MRGGAEARRTKHIIFLGLELSPQEGAYTPTEQGVGLVDSNHMEYIPTNSFPRFYWLL